jgi:hypothetical protein
MIPTRTPTHAPLRPKPLQALDERRPHGRRGRGLGSALSNVLIAALALAFVAYLAWTAWDYTRVEVDLIGLENNEFLLPTEGDGRQIGVKLSPDTRIEEVQLLVDGEPAAEDLGVENGVHRWLIPQFEERSYDLSMEVTRPMLGPTTVEWTYTVDGTQPELTVTEPGTVEMDAEVVIPGSVNEEVTLTVNGEEVDVDRDGTFELRYDRPPLGFLEIEARDLAGNTTSQRIRVPVSYPEIRAVHVSAAAWADDELRSGVMRLIDEGRINAVQLDIKDELGVIGYDSDVDLANEIGADQPPIYDAEEALDTLHELGMHVIGRVVAFRDPILAEHAADTGQTDMLAQGTDGEALDIYRGGFTNFAHPDVQQYNLDVAVEAAELGFDDIMFDYIRRPDGDLNGMVFDGLMGPDEAPEEDRSDEVTATILDYLERSHVELREQGAYQGAAVFGIAAKRGDQIGQEAGEMVAHLDYISPMLYPSHFGEDEYNVKSPTAEPGKIVERSMREFVEVVEPWGVPLVPWLQDFTLGSATPYGDAEVRQQIDAAYRESGNGFLLWNASVRYHGGALEPAEG